MNTDIFEGKWEQTKGYIREKWGDLTDDDIEKMKGNSEQFSGIMQEKYGKSKEEVDSYMDEMNKLFS